MDAAGVRFADDVRVAAGGCRHGPGPAGLTGMRPIQEVVSRIRYDPAIDARRFVIGYEERGAGIRESPLPAFVAGSDVPWHRVRYVRAGDTVVWDRQARIDLVGTDLAALLPSQPGTPVRAASAGEPVQVAVYNVLSDAHERHRTYPHRRVPACVELLGGLGADVIALHEVTHELWSALLVADWVRSGYHVSDGPAADAAYGTVLLSRRPLRIESHRRQVVGVAPVGGVRVAFAAAHLTSNRAPDAPRRRAHELRLLDERLSRPDVDAAVILADVNFGDDTPIPMPGIVDVWPALYPYDAGYTFDPAANPLAAIGDPNGRPGRLDRILLRGEHLVPVEIQRFGDRPFAVDDRPRYVSDHFGLTALLTAGP
ncbi:RNA repair domain-containing protein [Dactylosporangium sp. NPDC049742]|uniref:RNA repair domain-containing protein n=1 Tax=Dactylosporangium sp. NPDC049742 TaxID=3154737 RepID=UPI0034472AE2